MREHDIRRFFVAAKCWEGRRQEVGCRVVVNDEDVCRGANGSKTGHIRMNQDQSGCNSPAGRWECREDCRQYMVRSNDRP